MTKQSGTFLERFFTDLNQIPSKRKRQFEKVYGYCGKAASMK